MDMLYARYSSPMDLVNAYINRGRFGDFVKNFIQAEHERKKAEADKDEEWHMWIAYVHSYSDKPFNDWKAQFTSDTESNKKTGGDYALDDTGIQGIIDDLFPSSTTKG